MPKKILKNVVYLFGSGSTQAEANIYDNTIKLQAKDIAEGMLNKIIKKKIRVLFKIKNDLSNPDVDVEQIITLYESAGSPKFREISTELKKIYKEEIEERLNRMGPTFSPKMLTALIDMHEIKGIDEEISGIITLNYEDLIEKAIFKVKGSIDYAIKFRNNSKHFKQNNINNKTIPLLKLHGSFNWKNEFPVCLVDKIKREDDVLWIPPGVEKNKNNYPFSLIWGKAKEMLNCDILRVVGCSLNRNDWQLISLLYSTQRLNSQEKEYIIELINYQDVAADIKKEYSYLRCIPIVEIEEVREYIFNSFRKKASKRSLSMSMVDYVSSQNSSINILDVWLKAKGEYLINKHNKPIDTANNFFKDYVQEV